MEFVSSYTESSSDEEDRSERDTMSEDSTDVSALNEAEEKENDDSTTSDEPNEELPQLDLPISIKQRLFGHQIYGVNWMYKLFLNGSGGILADDMGLGKVSLSSFLCLCFDIIYYETIVR